MPASRFALPRAALLLPGMIALLLAVAPGARADSFHSTAIDVSADGEEVWVVNPDHATVGVIKTRYPGPNQLIAEIPVGREPWCIAYHPTNGEVWVTSFRDDQVYVIDATTRTVIDSIPAGYETFGVAFDPTGTTALVTASGSAEVFLIDVGTRAVLHTFDVYERPRGIAWRPDGQRAWISHLLMPEYHGKLTVVDPVALSTSEINIQQVFGLNEGGYPSSMQNITLAPAPFDSLLWMPTHLINSAKGVLSGLPLTPTNLFHSVVRPVNVVSETDLNWDTYFLSEGGTPARGYSGGTTPVGGSTAVDFRLGRAYVANMWSNDVTVLDDNILIPVELYVFDAGDAPIGLVTHPDIHRVYVANWLSRDVTVFNPSSETWVATVPSTSFEPLADQILAGKKLFFTSTGRMSFENRNSCSGCHVFGRSDGRNWDLSGSVDDPFVRASKDTRGIAFTEPSGWTSGQDEVQDNEWSIRGLLGGAGLIDGLPNPSLGAPNTGMSEDLDYLAQYINASVQRPDTPYLLPDGSRTAEADSGEVLFHDPVVGCADCHGGPFYTDSWALADPYIKHDVGTADSTDLDGADGYDTPSLVGTWEKGPWLHNHRAKTLEQVLTTYNAGDLHGVTSHLSPEQIGYLVDFMNTIAWPDSTGLPVDSPEVGPAVAHPSLERPFPNPFREATSLRFSLERSPSAVEIDVYDVAGRRVRTLLDRRLPRGTHIVGWDMKGDDGRLVSPGVYFARLVVDGDRRGSQKMTVLR